MVCRAPAFRPFRRPAEAARFGLPSPSGACPAPPQAFPNRQPCLSCRGRGAPAFLPNRCPSEPQEKDRSTSFHWFSWISPASDGPMRAPRLGSYLGEARLNARLEATHLKARLCHVTSTPGGSTLLQDAAGALKETEQAPRRRSTRRARQLW